MKCRRYSEWGNDLLARRRREKNMISDGILKGKLAAAGTKNRISDGILKRKCFSSAPQTRKKMVLRYVGNREMLISICSLCTLKNANICLCTLISEEGGRGVGGGGLLIQ